MFRRWDRSCPLRVGAGRHGVVLAVWLLFGGVAAAQNGPATTSQPALAGPAAIAMPLKPGSGGALSQSAGNAPFGVRRITLQDAQQIAAAAANPVTRLGQLQVEAAAQHRMGVKALYFPSISTQLEGLHLNKAPGEVLTVQRPIAGTTLSVPVNLIEQDQIGLNFTVIQPITPIFAVRQLVKIARADENIARAKAGLPVGERASLIEKNYFDLLVADRELIVAGADARKIQARWVTVSNSAAPMISATSTERQTDTIDAAKGLLLAASKMKELTASLNDLLGLPPDTRLELVPPDPLVESLSFEDAAAQASGTSAEVIEAEQTAVKAHAASTLAKMEYFPIVAALGGYIHQTAINTVLPESFAYVGFMATYTLFDSGKREHGVKEGSLQAKAADLGVELTKAKVALAVKTAYFELERSRELNQLARRMASASRAVDVSYVSEQQDLDPAQARMEAELFRAELEHRQAYARVKGLMGAK